jgi:RNA polymerase sigma factor (sigma-70 family)
LSGAAAFPHILTSSKEYLVMLEQSARLSVCAPAGARAEHRLPPIDPDLAPLVRAGAGGDPVALERLVVRFDRMLRSVTRSYRLSRWDADDVIQTTWLQFMQHGRALREPAALSGWLVTTARRQSLQLLQRHVRERLMDDPTCDTAGDHAEPDRELLAAERRDALHRALAELPDRQRDLMRLLVANPVVSYEEVGRQLAMPVGSIGPTRARSLDRLRRTSKLRALQAANA